MLVPSGSAWIRMTFAPWDSKAAGPDRPNQLGGILAKQRLASAHEPDAPDPQLLHLVEERLEALAGELEVTGPDLRGRAEEAIDVAAVLPRDLDDPRRRRSGGAANAREDRLFLAVAEAFPRIGHVPDLSLRIRASLPLHCG